MGGLLALSTRTFKHTAAISSLSITIMSVHATSFSSSHNFSKRPQPHITLLKDLGVLGDCHNGITVQHLSRLHINPPPLNLRQVHLLQSEILHEFGVKPGEMGENITTVAIDLLRLGRGTRIRFLPGAEGANGAHVEEHPVVRVTGLRNPCPQIEKFQVGLQEKFIVRDGERRIVSRRAGVMGVVEVGGLVEPGMRLEVEEPLQYEPLECV